MTTNPRTTTDALGAGQEAPGARTANADAPLVRLNEVAKCYGHTQALAGAELDVRRGEVVGVVGHNGAGKSTLMRVIVGITVPDRGRIEINGEPVDAHYSPLAAREAGIRIVFQELSLCPTLRLFESVLISRPSIGGRGWRPRARRLISRQLDEIFPGHGISPWARIDTLSLAQKHMVEIAQAMVGDDVRLVILDEPTSALSQAASDMLFRFIAKQRAQGISFLFITHRMREVLAHTQRIFVMRDGKVVATRHSKEVSNDDLVILMGGTSQPAATRVERRAVDRPPAVQLERFETKLVHDINLVAYQGEVVGLAGLEGQGQQELLLELWHTRRRRRGALRIRGRIAFVTGNRRDSGVFPLWSLALNLSVGSLRRVTRRGAISRQAERALARTWIERLNVRGAPGTPVLDLSGGTQQKVLIARALAGGADVILLDDPFRGVDVSARQDTYRLIRDEASSGRCFIWFSTESLELEQCERVYVLRNGAIVAELTGGEITEERIIASSFAQLPDERIAKIGSELA
jgi:ribose transport system ATP-binding protein